MKTEQKPAPPSIAPGPMDAAVATIERLIAAGKAKQAVELAKEQHKKINTPQTEERLVRAYVARIEQFHGKGMGEDAQSLLELVSDRYPGHRHLLGELRWRGAVSPERIGQMLLPLLDEHTSAETRQIIENLLRTKLTDPSMLAAAEALPAEHPLRASAAAIVKAFEAVTAGPVSDEQVALPMVSRRSPLAPWKLLIRAIAAFYRREDGDCRRALDAIDPDAAVGPMARALGDMLNGAGCKTGAAGVLASRVTRDVRPMAAGLSAVDRAFREADLPMLEHNVRDVLRQCVIIRPEFVERLKQHFMSKAYLAQAPTREMLRIIGPCRKDAFFWKQFALSAEAVDMPEESAAYWERFVRHSASEGAFAEHSPEAGMIWLHLAKLLARASPREIEEARDEFAMHKIISSHYQDQPPGIAALKPASDSEYARSVFDPFNAFSRSAKSHPSRPMFQQWWGWGAKTELPRKQMEDIAQLWSAAFPADIEPMLHLADLAEKRNALSMALKRIAAAEAVDSGNVHVRRARVRLMLGIAWRHFAEDKLNLVESDLRDLSALPGLMKTDAGAIVSFMRAIWRWTQNDRQGVAAEIQAGTNRLGPLVGMAFFRTVLKKSGVADFDYALAPPIQASPPAVDVARAEAAVYRLSEDLEMAIQRPATWDAAILALLREPNCPLAAADVLSIGTSAVLRADFEPGYLASSAGLALARTPAESARFLLLRARSLGGRRWGSARAAQCLRGAMELAKSAHDEKLLGQVMSEIDKSTGFGGVLGDRWGSSEQLKIDAGEILKREKAAAAPPQGRADADAHLVPGADVDADNYFHSDEDDIDVQPGLWDEEDDDENKDHAGAAGILPDVLELYLKQKGMSLEDLMSNPRKLLELISDPAGGLMPEQLRAMKAELRNLPVPGGSNSRRKKRRRR